MLKVFWVAFLTFQTTNQAALLVRVRDPQGASVGGARLTLFTRDNRVRVSAVTGDNGSYRFERLAPGEHLVEVEAPGFARARARAVRVQTGRTAEVDFELALAAFREQVVVTASGAAQTADEVSKAMTVVSEREIEERDEFAIAEALRTVPGLRVQQLGGPGAFSSIKTRGLRNEDTAVLIDGVRFRDAASTQGDASAFLEGLVVTDLDRLEVLRGSSSSLYGTNAIGGVINIVTREGGGRPNGSLLLEGGSLGFVRGRAQVAGGVDLDRITYSAGLSYFDADRGVDGDDAARNASAQGQVRFRFSPSMALSARIYALDASVALNESPQAVGALPPRGIVEATPLPLAELTRYEAGAPISSLRLDGANFIPSANDPDNTRDSRAFSAKVSFEQRPSDSLGYTVTYHGLSTERTFLDGPLGVSPFEPRGTTRSDFDGRIDTIGARADWQSAPANVVNLGYEFERQGYLNRSFPVDPSADSLVDVAERSHSFFVQDQLRLLAGALQLSGAFRAQFFSLKEPLFTPPESAPYLGISFAAPPDAYTGDASVAYFARSTKLRAHVGNGYRAPSLFERFGTFFGRFGYSAFGDPRLSPESSVALDAGVDQELLEGRLSTSATYFHTWLREVIVFDFSGAIDPATDPFGRFGGYRNADGGRARGLELSASIVPAGTLEFRVSYTYTDSTRAEAIFEDIDRSFIIPDHQLSLVASTRLGDNLAVVFDLAASSDYLGPVFDPASFSSRAFRFDGILKADLGASYNVRLSDSRRLRFFGKLENLAGRSYYENGFRTPGRIGVGGIAFHF